MMTRNSIERFRTAILIISTFSLSGLTAQPVFLEEQAGKWQNSVAYTSQLIALFPNGSKNYRPTETEMTVAGQIRHICTNMLWLSTTFLTGKKPGFSVKDYEKADMDSLKELFEKTGDFVFEMTRGFSPEDLDTKVDFAGGKLSKRQIFMLLNDHQTHHRGQLIVYARLKGHTPPRYVGW